MSNAKAYNGPCRITISRRFGGASEDRPICISVYDAVSGVQVIEVYMTCEQFGEAITGLQIYEGPTMRIIRGAISRIGCPQENKTEMVRRPEGHGRDMEAARAALAPFEIDGWSARSDDLFNHHRSEGEFQRVTFVRHVDPETGEPVVTP